MPLTDKKMPPKIKIMYHRTSLDDVMRSFALGFDVEFWHLDYFCDIVKGQIVFELLVEDTEKFKEGSDAS